MCDLGRSALKLSRRNASAKVARLGNWSLRGNVIARRLRFVDFADAMHFVNKVARLAEAANHHPDITISYNKVRLALTTHDEGGLTEKDFKLARKINKLVK
jgi:4a-hydroxytetrahydrobiopterin dehydratase